MNTTELSDMTNENHNRRHADEVSLRQTQEMPVTPERLDAVYPEVRCRPEHDESTPAECIAFAVDAMEIRSDVSTTLRDVPAIEDDEEEVEEDGEEETLCDCGRPAVLFWVSRGSRECERCAKAHRESIEEDRRDGSRGERVE
jgi:hypothetical protein